jgi:hypothetical protein
MLSVDDMAVKCCRLVKGDPHTYIANFTPAIYWLAELHDRLVKYKEINHFRTLPKQEKQKYWNAVCLAAPRKDKYTRVIACFACYTYDLITFNNDLS